MFTRMTATKWKLDDEGRAFVGSLLIYMRNEFRAGVSAAEHHPEDIQSEAVWGAAANYKRMMECIDRMLARLDGTWDAHKLMSAYDILQRAVNSVDGGRLHRQIINQCETHYGALGHDSCWSRSNDARNTGLLGTSREVAALPFNPDGSAGSGSSPDEHNGPGRPGACTDDSSGTGERDRHGAPDHARGDNRDSDRDTHGIYIPSYGT